MKKLLFISLILFYSCTKVDIDPTPNIITVDDIFSVKESKVTNGQSIHFNVPSNGTYILTLINHVEVHYIKGVLDGINAQIEVINEQVEQAMAEKKKAFDDFIDLQEKRKMQIKVLEKIKG